MDEHNKATEGEQTAASEQNEMTGRTPWDTVLARVISLVSRKGGVGKTTSAVNLGAAFALSGHTVLVVGLDPQCGVSRTLGYGPEDLDSGLGEIFTEGRSLHHLARTTPLPNLFFVSPNIRTLPAEQELERQLDGQVDVFLQEIDRARDFYDTILIDCPPSFGAATRAALLASDSYLVPVQAEELCRDSLGRLLEFIASFTRDAYATSTLPANLESPLEREGLFMTMVNGRTRMGRHVVAKVTEDYADEVFETAVPRTTRLTEMALKGKPAVIYDRRSPGSRAYFNLADEILMRHLQKEADTEPAEAPAEAEKAPAASGGNGDRPAESGIEQLLRELQQSTGATPTDAVFGAGPKQPESDPEMVSLDDVLAEEERLAGQDSDEWEEGVWGDDRRRGGRLN